tara:strand:- start:445 stop:621 length:177 start_codon:yes stop_codon:yes gene_type:complete
MDIIRKMLERLGDKETNDIYLREIALLMEENDIIKGKVREQGKTIKKLKSEIRILTDE